MMKKEISIFATQTDLSLLLESIETKESIYYILSGLFDLPDAITFDSYKNIPNLGISLSGDRNLESCYLVAYKGTSIKTREIAQRRGGLKFAVDQLANQGTIAFRSSGVYGEHCLIAGQVGTVLEDLISAKIYKVFATAIEARFNKIKSYFVGEEASQLLDKGWRLTARIKSPLLYDLTRD